MDKEKQDLIDIIFYGDDKKRKEECLEKLLKLETKKAEVRALKPIREICNKLDDDYGEFDALDDIEKYLKLQAEEGK